MTNEEKQLLIKDLSARLPYGVMVQYPNIFLLSKIINSRLEEIECSLIGIDEYRTSINGEGVPIEYVKPYLRPMSSMLKEERTQFLDTCIYVRSELCYEWTCDSYDWLNEHNFDYRGLIEKGLAIEAPEGMYITK